MTAHPPELLIVLPVYNEQESIGPVVRDWFAGLKGSVESFLLLVIDDGSTDGTMDVLEGLMPELGASLETISRENRGHGQTCLQGYRIASERSIPWVLQIDSDGQCDPRYFGAFWDSRVQYDVVYGKRTREDGIRRILASIVLRTFLRIGFGVDCIDPNVPYRLMRTKACEGFFHRISDDFFLANVALSVLLRKASDIRHGSIPIRFRQRMGGEPSVPLSRFAMKALELSRQLKALERGARGNHR